MTTSPRPHGRGPIEASFPGFTDRAVKGSPRPHGRGPIEARAHNRLRRMTPESPRPHGRGPIEAVQMGIRERGLQANLHGLMAVAPLKHRDRVVERPNLCAISTAS